MTTLTLQIENPSIIPSLRKVLGALDGVTVSKVSHKAAKAEDPNKCTIAAMKEAQSGKDTCEVKLDSYDSFVNSIMQ